MSKVIPKIMATTAILYIIALLTLSKNSIGKTTVMGLSKISKYKFVTLKYYLKPINERSNTEMGNTTPFSEYYLIRVYNIYV